MRNEALNRYDRHIKLDKVGLIGQEKLTNAKVLVVGAGGLGCPVLQYLCAAGVGHIGIIDGDTVDLSNLQRQILYKTSDVGKSKAETAKKSLEAQNNLIIINAFNTNLTTKNAIKIFKLYDIIVDCTDNFATRYMINDACVILDKILIYGAIHTFEGQVSVFNYQGGPNYRTLFPTPPLPGSTPDCSEVGVIGILPGLIGTFQATEVIKIILGIGAPLSGILFVKNVLTNQSYQLKINPSDTVYPMPNNIQEFEEMNYPVFCGILPQDEDEVAFDLIGDKINNANVLLLDVREPHEQPKFNQGNILYIPMGEIPQNMGKLPSDKIIYVFCHLGFRSLNAVKYLKSHASFLELKSIKGGIEKMV